MLQSYNEIINDIRNQANTLKKQKERRKYIDFTYESFKVLFKNLAEMEFLKRNIRKEFIFDEQTQMIVKNIFFWLKNDVNFNGNTNLGILLVGSKGTGKTTIMRVLIQILKYAFVVVDEIYSKKLTAEIKCKGISYFERRILFIDDIGKENVEANDYGTKINPFVDLIGSRYEIGSLTFATSNYKIETLSTIYGDTITDRFKEIFNIYELIGESKR